MRFLALFAFFLAIISAVVGKHVSFKTCGSTILSPKYIDVEPYPPKSGKDVTIKVRANSDILIHGGTASYRLELKFPWIGYQTLTSGDVKLCSIVSCPLKPGTVNYETTVKLPSLLIPGDYRAKIWIKDSTDKELACIESEIDVDALLTEDEKKALYSIRKPILWMKAHAVEA